MKSISRRFSMPLRKNTTNSSAWGMVCVITMWRSLYYKAVITVNSYRPLPSIRHLILHPVHDTSNGEHYAFNR